MGDAHTERWCLKRIADLEAENARLRAKCDELRERMNQIAGIYDDYHREEIDLSRFVVEIADVVIALRAAASKSCGVDPKTGRDCDWCDRHTYALGGCECETCHGPSKPASKAGKDREGK